MSGPEARFGVLRRFGAAREGAAAVEFALIAMPFFLLTFALAEVTMAGFAQTSLDFAVANTSRQVRTGEVQTDGVTAEQLKSDICDTMNWLLAADCDGNLYLDIDTYESFVDVDPAMPIEDGELNEGGFGFDPGEPSDIVVVRAFYRWRTITPYFEQIFANTNNGERILASTMMFRNEPFPPPP